MKVCVVGLGYWGPNLVRNFLAQDGVSQVICVDQDPGKLKRAGQLFPAAVLTHDYQSVLEDESVEAIAIATPVASHFELASKALDHHKHVFIEKPIATTVKEADSIIQLAKKHNSIVQVGHIERFNPALLALSDLKIEPKYIEVHRMAPFMSRGTDVPEIGRAHV
mgnify:CR=1 FL=1